MKDWKTHCCPLLTTIFGCRRVPGHVQQQQPQLVPPRGQARQVEEVLLRPVPRGQQGVEGESYFLDTLHNGCVVNCFKVSESNNSDVRGFLWSS